MVRRLRGWLARFTANHTREGRPRWRSRSRLAIAALTALFVGVPIALVIAGQTARLDEREQTSAYILIFGAMLALGFWSFVQLNGAILDMIFLRNAFRYQRTVPDDQWTTAYHLLEVSVYRALGKFCIIVFMAFLVLARNDDVRRWLAIHPLFLGALIFAAMVLFTAVDVLTYLFGRAAKAGRPIVTVDMLLADLAATWDTRFAALEARLGRNEGQLKLLTGSVNALTEPYTDTSEIAGPDAG